MAVNVEIPGDRVYKDQQMLVSTDIQGGIVLDFINPKNADTSVMVYMGNEELVQILDYLQTHQQEMQEKQAKRKTVVMEGIPDEPPAPAP